MGNFERQGVTIMEQVHRPAVLAVQGGDRDEIQTLLMAAAERFRASGVHVIGSVEHIPPGTDHQDVMLVDLVSGQTHRLHQDLGSGASGCSLDPVGLASACAQVEAAIAERLAAGGTAADTVVILSKYGREEAEGRGFTSAFYAAVAGELSVLTSLSPAASGAWEGFVGDMAQVVNPDLCEVDAWWSPHASFARAG